MHNNIQNTTYTFITHTHTYIHYIYTTWGQLKYIYLVTYLHSSSIPPNRLLSFVNEDPPPVNKNPLGSGMTLPYAL